VINNHTKLTSCIAQHDQLCQLAHTPTTITIVGGQNTTKSTLASAITGHAKNEAFESGEGRVTQRIQKLIHNGVQYIDTPGLGFMSEDDDEALSVFDETDIFIFTHRADSGELDKEEVMLLEKTKELKNSSLIFALTAYEGKTKEGAKKIILKIKSQLAKSGLNGTPIIPVSCDMYYSGLELNCEELTANSGILALTSLIDEHSTYVTEKRGQKLYQARSNIHKTITDIKSTLKTRKKFLKSQIKAELHSLDQATQDIKLRF